jgi:hypothetical protein
MNDTKATILIFATTIIIAALGNFALITIFGNPTPQTPARLSAAIAMAAWTFACCCFGTIAYINEVPLGFLKGENRKA